MSQSFLSVATRWKAEKRQWVKPSSYASYVRIVNAHLLPHFGRGGRPGEAAIQAFVNAELGRGLSRKTVQDALVVLKMILRYGEKAGAWPHRDFEVHFPATAVSGRGVQVLTRSDQRQLAAFLRAYPTPRNVGILLCLHSGLRIGEVCARQWREIGRAHV